VLNQAPGGFTAAGQMRKSFLPARGLRIFFKQAALALPFFVSF
jgi:hypothetical protein